VQPLYSRGWGLSPILPNGNGIAVLRKRFDFWSAEALEEFLADLNKYEKKKQHHAKTNVIKSQHAVLVNTWTHVARRRSLADADVKDEDEDHKTPGVTARDIRLAYALEGLFESALAADGEEYIPHVRPEADRPRTVEELEGYS
jgi:pterin-4a-carbinolamine dehydratase